MEKTINKSKQLFDSGFGCAEAVLMAVSEYKNIQSDLIPKIATGLCGGLSKTNGMCGAVSGGVLALSMIYGRTKVEDSRDELNAKTQAFIHEFTEKYGSVGCTALTGCDLSTDEGLDEFDKFNVHAKCCEFVGEATRLVLEIL
ncbi:C-GCAxxG-C-C family protein [Desulfosarcina sp.]|nr:C-GCAxxG-C-C family protein [Desulfosarcina sp.]